MNFRHKGLRITALLILVSATIYAFSILTNWKGVYRKYLKYADGGKQYIPFIYQISQDTPEEYTAGINAGAAVWTDVETAYWVFEEGERTSETRNKRDQTNLIFFDVDNSSGSFEEGTSTIAYSMTWSNISAQEGYHAVESDMVWNARDYPPSADPDYCPDDQFDLQSVIAHELGHHLGLGHTGSHGSPPGIGELVPEATMYGYGYYGDTTKRSLHLQDIAGVSEIYPTWQLSGTVSDSSAGTPLGSAYILMQNGQAVSMGPPETVDVEGSKVHEVAGYIVTDTLAIGTDGSFRFTSLDDDFALEFNCFGYYPKSVSVQFGPPGGIEETQIEALDIRLRQKPNMAVSGAVSDSLTRQPIRSRLDFYSILNPSSTPIQSVETDDSGLFATALPEGPYRVLVYPESPYPQFQIAEVSVAEGGLQLDLELNPAEVLLIDADGGEDDWLTTLALFDSLDVPAHLWDVDAEDSLISWEGLQKYTKPYTVFWLNQRETEAFTQQQYALIDSLLANGGNLFLNGTFLSQQMDSLYLRDRLHTHVIGASQAQYLRSSTDDPIGQNQMMLVTTLNEDKDILFPDGDLRSSMVFELVGTAGCAMLKHEADYHLIVSAFVFEEIFDEAAAFVNRQQLLERSLAWFRDSDQPTEMPELLRPRADTSYVFSSRQLDLPIDWEAVADPEEQEVSYIVTIRTDSSYVSDPLAVVETNQDSLLFALDIPCEMLDELLTLQLFITVWATDGVHYTPSPIVPYHLELQIAPGAPDPFALLAPAAGSAWQIRSGSQDLLFQWQSTSDPNCDPVDYELNIAQDAEFSDIIHTRTGLVDTVYALVADTLLNILSEDDFPVDLYWRVSASDGEQSRVSDTLQFTAVTELNTPPDTPVLNQPLLAETILISDDNADTLLVFQWESSDPDKDPLHFDFCLYAADAMISDTLRQSDLSENQVEVAISDLPGYPLEYGVATEFQWFVAARDSFDTAVSDTLHFFIQSQVAVAVERQALAPAEFKLEPNYPNPFNPYTTIYFQLPRQESVRLLVYDLRGNLVKVLLDGELQPGRYQCIWDGTDVRGQRVANGIYLYAITSAEFRAVRKMIFMK